MEDVVEVFQAPARMQRVEQIHQVPLTMEEAGEDISRRLENISIRDIHVNHHPLHTDTCGICLSEDMNEQNSYTTMCGHNFHTECINPWREMSVRCPTCRQRM
jgi:Ring finger domain